MLPSNGKLYSKVISWVQRSLWENGEPLERLMEEVSMRPLSSLPSSYLSPYITFRWRLTQPLCLPADVSISCPLVFVFFFFSFSEGLAPKRAQVYSRYMHSVSGV